MLNVQERPGLRDAQWMAMSEITGHQHLHGHLGGRTDHMATHDVTVTSNQRGRTRDAVRGFQPQLRWRTSDGAVEDRRTSDGSSDEANWSLDGRRHGRLQHQQQRCAHLRCNAQLRDAQGTRARGQHLRWSPSRPTGRRRNGHPRRDRHGPSNVEEPGTVTLSLGWPRWCSTWR